ncbi:phospho-sugar mutase [Humidisolicoccus flavus]|uniref:phospho-sugar mutase n=1 Tax=Humidisolicoccus flavus TaxID=3111414 RepID=UPI00324BACD6
MTTDALFAAAESWLAQDPDESTSAELRALIDSAQQGNHEAVLQLEARFEARLAFGTAGIRGELGAGPMRMNRVLVGQAAAGLAAFLLERDADASIVIGYDGRVNSDVFARDTAEIMAGAGVRTLLLPRLMPTPVTAFAVRHLDTSAGVMVTASHNPPRDNGFKVYLGDDDEGSQIVAPVDAEIAQHIATVAETISLNDVPRSSQYEVVSDGLWEAYVSATAKLSAAPQSPDLRVVYSAMHGVGWETVRAVLAHAGYAEPIPVLAQIEPDGSFPTVDFPNPEEPGALDLAIATAREHRAHLILANDPDADRLAVCIPDERADNGWRALTGNEIGLLLGWDAASRADSGVLAASIVSSPGLRKIAEHFSLDAAETLTGFKWVSRVPGMIFGFEEALGYCVDPQVVRDKDGISALLRVLAIADGLAAKHETLASELERIAEAVGGFASGQVSVRVDDLRLIGVIMANLRAHAPSELGGDAVVEADDLSLPEHGAKGDILRFTLESGSRVMVRPSGTEPKVKVYIDAASTTGSGAERIASAKTAVATLSQAAEDLLARAQGE